MTPEMRPGRGQNLVGAMLERRYRVDSLIARGGMSTVYRGLDTRLDRPVALKVMDSQYSGDRSFVERFEREARAAARLHDPDVVAVYDQGVDREIDGDHVYLVMQLVEGCTLRDLLIAQGSLPLPLALSVMEPILSALAAAHRAGMVHRDVKPENVLLGRDGSVKVADFGLVRAAASAGATSGSIILGTVAYLSPEQVTTGAADARTDVYSAGIVLYEMLTGAPPYVGDTAMSVAYRHVNDNVPAPSDQVPELPPAIDDLVLRATRRDESVRPADASVFLSEVQRVRTQLGIPSVGIPVPASEQRTARMPSHDSGAATDQGPPTDQIDAVPADPSTQSASGPRHTRTMLRPNADEEDQTEEMAAVVPAETGKSARQPRRRGRRTVAVWTVVVLVLAGLLAGTAWWMGSGRYIEVPRAVGEPEAVAQQVLQGAGLQAEVSRELNDTVPRGTVVSSDPAQGSRLLTGDSVHLVVSLGLPKVPNVAAGTSQAEAESAIRGAHLEPKHDESADQYHRTIPEGSVLSIQPAAGTSLRTGSPVNVVLSKGPPPVPVPDVGGADKDDAFAALRKAGFEPYEAGQQFDSNVEAGHVISTNPGAGSQVRLFGKPRVGVVVSNAVTVPDLNGRRAEEAKQIMAGLGLQLDVQSFFQGPNGLVLGQFPSAGTKVEPGSTVHATTLF